MNDNVISKIRCNNPNKHGSITRNYNHAVYIATRPGTDLTTLDGQEAYGHGLFGNINVNHDINDIANEIRDKTAAGYNIYNGIISLSERDAAMLGYLQKENWNSYMHSVMPTVGRTFGIPVNRLQWAAAYHLESGHPHCHYVFWDNEKKVKSPYIHSSTQNKVREYLSGELSKEERLIDVCSKTAARDAIISFGKDIMADLEPQSNKIPQKMSKELSDNLHAKMIHLIPLLPGTGRLNYAFMSPDIKKEIDSFTELILEHKSIALEVQTYINNVQMMSDSYTASERHAEVNTAKAKNDLYNRIGNIILKSCKSILSQTNIHELFPPDFLQNIDLQDFDIEIPDTYFQDCKHHLSTINSQEWDLTDKNIHESHSFTPVLEWSPTYKKATTLLYTDEPDPEGAKELLLQEVKDQDNVLAYELLGKIYKTELLEDSTQTLADFYYKKAYQCYISLSSDESYEPKKNYPGKIMKVDPTYVNYKLGKFCEQGLGTDVNYENALKYYKHANGYKYADYSRANLYLYEKSNKLTPENIDQAMNLLKSSANQNFGYAAYSYAKKGLEYNKITEITANKYYASALQYFQKIEDKDDQVFYRIGTMYYKGLGINSDSEKAFAYFQKSASLKNADAYYALAKTYADPKDIRYAPEKAVEFFLLAIEKERYYACFPLSKLFLDNTSPLYNPELAVSCLRNGINHNDLNSLVTLGKLYLFDPCVGKDVQKGLNLLNAAIDQGSALSFVPLARFYLDRENPYYNPLTALSYLQRGMEKNDINSFALMGKIYLWGGDPDIEKNVEKGMKLLLYASAQGSDYAKQSIEIYKDIKCRSVINGCFSVFNNAFNSLLKENIRQCDLISNRKNSSLSKEKKQSWKKQHEI